MGNGYGYIKLYRSSMNDPLYLKEKFTKWQAWCDLLLLAYYAPSEFFIRGIAVKAKRGCVYYSTADLSERWRWSRGKVIRFLAFLEKDGRIAIDGSNLVNAISILNYDKFQQSDEPKDEAPTQADLLQSLIEQINEIREKIETQKSKPKVAKKKEPTPYLGKPIEERAAEFYNTLVPFLGMYGKEMLRKFYDYWSEKNKSGSRMRFEKETSWELSKRLSYWASRENDFNNKNNGNSKQAKEERAIDAINVIARLEAKEGSNDSRLWGQEEIPDTL